MSRSRKLQVEEQVSPNLIPMIDIMFLLLLFFMLGADMGQRDMEDVSLPSAFHVKDDKDEKGKKEKDRLTINVYHRYAREFACPKYEAGHPCLDEKHWIVGIRALDYTDKEKLAKLLSEEADRFRSSDAKESAASERRVMVRADGSAPYGFIQDIMGACMKVGIYQIECGAARPPDAKGKGA